MISFGERDIEVDKKEIIPKDVKLNIRVKTVSKPFKIMFATGDMLEGVTRINVTFESIVLIKDKPYSLVANEYIELYYKVDYCLVFCTKSMSIVYYFDKSDTINYMIAIKHKEVDWGNVLKSTEEQLRTGYIEEVFKNSISEVIPYIKVQTTVPAKKIAKYTTLYKGIPLLVIKDIIGCEKLTIVTYGCIAKGEHGRNRQVCY